MIVSSDFEFPKEFVIHPRHFEHHTFVRSNTDFFKSLRQRNSEAIALPAVLPVNRQQPKNVPSKARYPCIPPPPNPETSPAADFAYYSHFHFP
jgi:hypothetical protein